MFLNVEYDLRFGSSGFQASRRLSPRSATVESQPTVPKEAQGLAGGTSFVLPPRHLGLGRSRGEFCLCACESEPESGLNVLHNKWRSLQNQLEFWCFGGYCDGLPLWDHDCLLHGRSCWRHTLDNGSKCRTSVRDIGHGRHGLHSGRSSQNGRALRICWISAIAMISSTVESRSCTPKQRVVRILPVEALGRRLAQPFQEP